MSEIFPERPDVDEWHRLNATRKPGEWGWRGGYPQTIIASDASLIAECYTDPDAPAIDAEFIAYVGTHLDSLLGYIDRLERALA